MHSANCKFGIVFVFLILIWWNGWFSNIWSEIRASSIIWKFSFMEWYNCLLTSFRAEEMGVTTLIHLFRYVPNWYCIQIVLLRKPISKQNVGCTIVSPFHCHHSRESKCDSEGWRFAVVLLHWRSTASYSCSALCSFDSHNRSSCRVTTLWSSSTSDQFYEARILDSTHI